MDVAVTRRAGASVAEMSKGTATLVAVFGEWKTDSSGHDVQRVRGAPDRGSKAPHPKVDSPC